MIACQPYVLFILVDETGSRSGMRIFLRADISIASAQVAAAKMAANLGALSTMWLEQYSVQWRFVPEQDEVGASYSDNFRRGLFFVGEDELNGEIVEVPVLETVILSNECIEVVDASNSEVISFVDDLTSGFYTLGDGTAINQAEVVAVGRNYGPTVSGWMAGIT